VANERIEEELKTVRTRLETCIAAILHAPAELRRLEARIQEGLKESEEHSKQALLLEKKLEKKMEERMEDLFKTQESALLAGVGRLLATHSRGAALNTAYD
jgi:hypothetical protein